MLASVETVSLYDHNAAALISPHSGSKKKKKKEKRKRPQRMKRRKKNMSSQQKKKKKKKKKEGKEQILKGEKINVHFQLQNRFKRREGLKSVSFGNKQGRNKIFLAKGARLSHS